jgi:hypothetical protein
LAAEEATRERLIAKNDEVIQLQKGITELIKQKDEVNQRAQVLRQHLEKTGEENGKLHTELDQVKNRMRQRLTAKDEESVQLQKAIAELIKQQQKADQRIQVLKAELAETELNRALTTAKNQEEKAQLQTERNRALATAQNQEIWLKLNLERATQRARHMDGRLSLLVKEKDKSDQRAQLLERTLEQAQEQTRLDHQAKKRMREQLIAKDEEFARLEKGKAALIARLDNDTRREGVALEEGRRRIAELERAFAASQAQLNKAEADALRAATNSRIELEKVNEKINQMVKESAPLSTDLERASAKPASLVRAQKQAASYLEVAGTAK